MIAWSVPQRPNHDSQLTHTLMTVARAHSLWLAIGGSLFLVQSRCAAAGDLQKHLLQGGDRQTTAQHSQLSLTLLEGSQQCSEAAGLVPR